MLALFSLTLFRTPRALLPLALGALACSPLLQAADRDCTATARQVSRQVAAHPERTLIIVEDTLVVSDSCACEVVKAAIVAAKASAKLVGQIVLVAVNAAPAKATLISECAKAASPDAAAEVEAAVRKALGPDADRPSATPSATAPAAENTAPAPDQPADPKQPVANTKNPPAPTPTPATPPDPDYGLSPVAIGGVYLVYPGGGGSSQIVKGDDGKLYYIGPQGKRVPLEPPPPITQRPPRPPGIVIIRPPSPTTSDSIPEEPIPEDPIPQDPGPVEPPL
jgi:hypothetical protein